MPLHHDQIDDFVTATLAEEMRRDWVDISLDFQRFVFANRMVNGPGNTIYDRDGSGKKVEKVMSGVKGHKLKWRLQTANGGSYRHSELYAKETPVVGDHLVEAEVPWTKVTVNFSYDKDEDEFQGGYEELASLLSVRKHAMWNDYYVGAETDMWSSPTSSSQNPRVPLGIPFWLQKGSADAFSFQGGNPSGFSDGAAGISTSDHANWSNGAFRYVNVSHDDLFDKLDKAMEFCDFDPPDDFSQLDKGKPEWCLYTVFDVIQTCRKLLAGSNDNLGFDLGKYRTKVLFKGVPLQRVPALESGAAADSTNPIYGVNWNTMSYKYRGDKKPKVDKPVAPNLQPSVRTVFATAWGQFQCINRRANFVGHVA